MTTVKTSSERKSKVAITDYSFDELDIETSILQPLGCQVVGQKSGKDKAQLIALVQDADYVITQFAPVTAEVIGAMNKATVATMVRGGKAPNVVNGVGGK